LKENKGHFLLILISFRVKRSLVPLALLGRRLARSLPARVLVLARQSRRAVVLQAPLMYYFSLPTPLFFFNKKMYTGCRRTKGRDRTVSKLFPVAAQERHHSGCPTQPIAQARIGRCRVCACRGFIRLGVFF